MVLKRLFGKKNPSDNPARIRQSIVNAFKVEYMEELPSYIYEHPELLSEAAFADLDVVIQSAHEQNQKEAVNKLEMYRYLFWRCRVVGVEQAFGELRSPSQYYPPELKAIIQETESLHPSRDALQAMKLCQTGLKMVDRERYPFAWVWLNFDLGISYLGNLQDVRDENVEAALKALQTALRACNRGWYAFTWACIQISIGDAYTQRNQGVRTENIELAIEASQAALDVIEPQGGPEKELAQAHAVKGVAYLNRIEGFEADNVEQAVQSLEAALGIQELKVEPSQWANTQLNLGAALIRRTYGERAENIERAIDATNAALTVFERESNPELWAKAQNNLGIAYRNRIHGNHAENSELSIQAYQAALSALDAPTKKEIR